MDTRSRGAVPKQRNSGKKPRRNLTEQFATPNFGGRTPPNQDAPLRPNSTTTLSSQSIPATRPPAGFQSNNTNQIRVDVHHEDVIEVGMPERELDELIENNSTNAAPNDQSNNSSSNRATNGQRNDVSNQSATSQAATAATANRSSPSPLPPTVANEHLSNQQTTPNVATNAVDRSSQPPAPSKPNSNAHQSDRLATQNNSNASIGANANEQLNRMHSDQQFALQHGPNYRGNSEQAPMPVVSPPLPNPPMNLHNGPAHRSVFSSNNQLQMPSQPFYMPPLGMIQVDARLDDGNARNQRTVTDLRTVYLERLRENFNRLQTDAMSEEELKTMLDRSIDFANRITKFVEAKEDSIHLPEIERRSNHAMWSESIALVDRIKTDINTKLTYLQAGTQPTASEQRRIAHIRRLQAKMEPFGGNLEQWTNFKAKWLEYYHNCNDMSEFELFMKLDEFITPNSEAYGLIISYDRTINGSYRDAWEELCARYDNPRIQVDNIISKLLYMDVIENSRSDYVRAYSEINTFIHSLPRMNVDVSTWDPILVHLIERRLQQEVMAKWIKARTPREIPCLQQFIDFLIAEIDQGDAPSNGNQPPPNGNNNNHRRDRNRNHSNSRGNGQRHSNGQNGNRQQQAGPSHSNQNNRPPQAGPSQPTPANQQRQGNNAGAAGGAPQRVRSAVQKVIKCAICNMEQHKSYQCPAFLKLDMNGRIRKLRERKLCENCLRPNCQPNRCTLRNCTNTGCEEKHNRLVCPLTFAPTVSNVQSAESNQA